MFGFSLQKLIFTGLAIAAVIYGFRWFTAMQNRSEENSRKRTTTKRSSGAAASTAPANEDDDVQLMIECKPCGSYVAASGAHSCGRDDCPYPK
ncbi:MAG: hypothetical protein HON65_13185 [Rhodospirillales bacterium]|jgi:hypothetical protein|nr:hypothetical protein [Rhodospirillales bacterium]